MQLFTYSKARNAAEATRSGAAQGDRTGTKFLAGGTTLFDLMKLDVEQPKVLVDVGGLPFDAIEKSSNGGMKLGAMAKNSAVANHPEVLSKYSVLSQAILQGASGQIRNMASTAGNLLQRTRCVYFRDVDMPCNKREPGSGCSAIEGYNRNLAVLGVSDKCIASNPSDQNVALMALDARIHVQGSKGGRAISIAEFFKLPGDTPHIETALEKGELITHLELPPLPAGTKQVYLKLRDRASYEFALASTAAIVLMKDGRIDEVRLAMGGLGAIPWRAKEAEAIVKGQTPSAELFDRAARAVLAGAKPASENAFKIELGRRCLVHALSLATGLVQEQAA